MNSETHPRLIVRLVGTLKVPCLKRLSVWLHKAIRHTMPGIPYQVLSEDAPGVAPGGEVRRQEWCCGPTAPGENGTVRMAMGVAREWCCSPTAPGKNGTVSIAMGVAQ
eukprot:1154964-Pelagomonas_calceolata.AAC.7